MKYFALSLLLVGTQAINLSNQQKLEAQIRFASGDGYSDKGTEYYDRINSSVGDAVVEHYSKLGGGGGEDEGGEDEGGEDEGGEGKKDAAPKKKSGKGKKQKARMLNKKYALQALTSIMYANENLSEDNFEAM